MNFPITFCRNDRRRTTFVQGLTQAIGIKSLVGDQGIESEAINQVRYPDDLTALSGKQLEPNEIAQGIGECKNFGRQSAF